MPPTRIVVSTTLLGLGAALACADPAALVSPRLARAEAANEGTTHEGVVPYGVGTLRRRAPGSPCATGNYRQFDFWLGQWGVPGPNGAIGATNHIVAELDGCAIMENWRPPGGLVGRSLNSWDAEAGVWRQVWVPAAGRPVRMSGGAKNGRLMDLSGVRNHAVLPLVYTDSYWWSAPHPDTVKQEYIVEVSPNIFRSQGLVRYARQATLPPVVPSVGARCTTGDTRESRALDPMLGTWRVEATPGPDLGTSTIASDVDGCLFEERFTTTKGYAAIAWTYYDPIVQRWHRSIVDSEGERIELAGTRDGAVLTLEGAEPIPGHADARLRVVQRTAADAIRQEWSVSTDGGATWRAIRTITFVNVAA